MTTQPSAGRPHDSPGRRMTMTDGFRIPEAMKREHALLHGALVEATHDRGPVGDAARAVASVLHPHFVREEEIALPPLALLQPLVDEGVTPEMEEILTLTDALEMELPGMLREHDRIREAVERLRAVAQEQGDREHERLAEKLLLHAATEEQVTYPAAILVGRTVRAALRPNGARER